MGLVLVSSKTVFESTCFLAYSSQQQQGNCMDPSGFCAAQSNTVIIYYIFYSSSLTSRVRPIEQPIHHVVYTQERTRLYPIGVFYKIPNFYVCCLKGTFQI